MVLRRDGDNLLEYTTASEIAELTSDYFYESHGSHVAGTAAGSIVEGTNKQGMAPEADLLLCGLGNNLAESNMVFAIMKMFDYSKAVGKPCVINLSIGHVNNFHDGIISEVLRTLKEYYNEDAKNKEGRIVVFSSGNSSGYHAAIYEDLPAAGTDGYNLRTVLGETKEETHFDDELNPTTVNYYENINNFFYMQDGSDFDVDVKVVNVKTGEIYELTEKPIYTLLDLPRTSLPKEKGVNPVNNKTYVRFELYNAHMFHESDLKLAYFVKGPAGKKFRAMDRREGSTSGYHSAGLAGFTEGQDNGAFNAHTCGEEVISVGGYVSEYKWKSINGDTYWFTTNKENNKILTFSSWGVDDDGVSHPDVIAPGSAICSAYNYYDSSYFDDGGDVLAGKTSKITDRVTLPYPFEHDQYYGAMCGTSMAAPNATGVIALWLQAKPTMTYADVRDLIQKSSYHDEFTSNPENIPSHNVLQAGAGKIDALEGLRQLTGSTGIQAVEADGFRVIYKGKVYLNR